MSAGKAAVKKAASVLSVSPWTCYGRSTSGSGFYEAEVHHGSLFATALGESEPFGKLFVYVDKGGWVWSFQGWADLTAGKNPRRGYTSHTVAKAAAERWAQKHDWDKATRKADARMQVFRQLQA